MLLSKLNVMPNGVELDEDVTCFPDVTYPDIVTSNYLLFAPSPYSKDDLKAYKSLDAYNQFVCGWVRGVACYCQNNQCVVKAKVGFIKIILQCLFRI